MLEMEVLNLNLTGADEAGYHVRQEAIICETNPGP